MSDAWVIGVGSTPFGKYGDSSFRDLASAVTFQLLADAGLPDGQQLDGGWFANCGMHVWGQPNIRGQVALTELMRNGTLNARMPIINVEGGCATGSAALHGAVNAVKAGGAELTLALGVEKMIVPGDKAATFGLFQGGIDRLHPDEWQAFFDEAGRRHGQRFSPNPHRIMFLDIHAMQARFHMDEYGSDLDDLAAIAVKNHANGVLNPLARKQKAMTADEILEDKPVVRPFTRSMCSPVADGAAGALVCSTAFLDKLPAEVRDRAVKVRASAMMGGTWRELDQDNVVRHAADRAYAQAGITADDVHIAEVHDATAFCELLATEMLGFCAKGEGHLYARSGATSRDGERPVNTSGGLECKGHPLAATGLGMIHELVTQLRGEAGDRQVARQPSIGVQQNAGGLIGFDEALCSVAVLERVIR